MHDLPPEYQKAKDAAKTALNEPDVNQAFSVIRPFLDYPGLIVDDHMWNDIFALLKTIVGPVLGEPVDSRIQAVIDNPNDVDSLYNLAYSFYEESLNGISATLLRRALDIDPANEDVITELSANLEVLMMFDEAHQMLTDSRKHFDEDSFCLYLLGFNSLMTGNIDEPKSILPLIENDPDSTIQYLHEKLSGMVNRALALKETCTLNKRDLRGWHMVLNGSILLHLSPFGFDEGMNGRYAFVGDSYSLIKDGIMRLEKVLKTANLEMNTIVALPDRSSRIVAIATSKLLDIPLIDWNDFDEESPGLIVAYDLQEIQDEQIGLRLQLHHPQQILWAHSTCWTNVFPYAADLTTFLYQSKIAPWDAQLTMIDGEVQTGSADETSEVEIADRIVNTEIDESYFDDVESIIDLVANLRNLDDSTKPGIFQISGKRLRLREGSPVRSNMFQ